MLEIEPGTAFVANCGSLVAEVNDVVDTGSKGHRFIKANTGMDALTRPSLYGSRHPIISIPLSSDEDRPILDYAVVGHCCETGDLFTQKLGGDLELRPLRET